MRYRVILSLFILFTAHIGCESHAKSIRIYGDIPIQEQLCCSNTTYVIRDAIDLGGDTIMMPLSSVLKFKAGGSIKNGTLVGNNTKIKFARSFLGKGVKIIGCTVAGKRVIKDEDVFLSVSHSQDEIQTLFDISGGKRIVFTQGVYENIDRITITGNVDADFRNSTIKLYRDTKRVGECFYMKPWVDRHIGYVRIKNLRIEGESKGIKGDEDRRCIQLLYVSDVELENITIDKYYGGPEVYKSDASDLLDKTRIGTSAIAIMKYDRCVINRCLTNDINKEIFWCVPNNNPRNITYFTNNISTCSHKNGSSSFFTLLDGRCIVKGNKVYNYNGSAFNAFCYDSEISNNQFYDGKRSIAIDLSEGTMYRAQNVYVHDNECHNTKGLLSAFGEDIRIKSNKWYNDTELSDERFIVVTVNSRGGRKDGSLYIGCDNNPELADETRNITIEDNICEDRSGNTPCDIRFALLYGSGITLSNNHLRGFKMPVVQLVEGNGFEYKNNIISDSREGHYSELLINNGSDIKIEGNVFHQNNLYNNMNCTVQILKAQGKLTYQENQVSTKTPNLGEARTYIPCFVKDYTDLNEVVYMVKAKDMKLDISTGLESGMIELRTNILK